MAGNKANGKPGIGRGVLRELDRLKKKVGQLTARLQSGVKAREFNARLAAEAKKAREQVTKEAKGASRAGAKTGLAA